MERREHYRVRLRLPARIRWRTPFEQRIEVRETLDVSPGGLRFLSTREYEPGARLILWFNPGVSSPWRSRGEFRAVVVRSDPEPDGRALIVAVCRIRE